MENWEVKWHDLACALVQFTGMSEQTARDAQQRGYTKSRADLVAINPQLLLGIPH